MPDYVSTDPNFGLLADDRSDLNDLLNQDPSTQFLGKPGATPTPTPTPAPSRVADYLNAIPQRALLAGNTTNAAIQNAQYASTDPNFGLGQQSPQYASTDPNFGLNQTDVSVGPLEDVQGAGDTGDAHKYTWDNEKGIVPVTGNAPQDPVSYGQQTYETDPSLIPDQGTQEAQSKQFGQEHPYVYGVGNAIREAIPTSPKAAWDMFFPPAQAYEDVRNTVNQVNDVVHGDTADESFRKNFPDVDYQQRAISGEFGPEEQAKAIAGLGIQVGTAALPFFHGGAGIEPEAPKITITPEDLRTGTEAPPSDPVDQAYQMFKEGKSADEIQQATGVSQTELVKRAMQEQQSGAYQEPTEAPVNAPEAPVARPDAEAGATEPEAAAAQPVDVAPEPSTGIPTDEFQARGAEAGQRDTASEGNPAVERPSGAGNVEEGGQGTTEGAPAGTSNRQNAETYGEGEIPSGQGADTVQLLDNARADIRSGAVDPYSVLSKTRARGIANPEEYAALAAEHERLVNDAVAKQKANSPDAPQAVQAATDFANAIQPHKTAASDLFRSMQGDLNYDLGSQFGIDQYMKSELGRGMKPSEVPKFTRMANDIGRAEGEVPRAVERSDVKVQRQYAKVADIPITDAAERVRQMLKDCV